MKKHKLFLLATLTTFQISAAAPVTFGTPTLGGTGCQKGQSSSTASPDGSSLSIFPGGFSVQTGPDGAEQRQSCLLSIPIAVRESFVLKTDYRGFHDHPDTSSSRQRVSYDLDQRSVSFETDHLHGPATDNHFYSHQIMLNCTGNHVVKLFVQTLLNGANASYTLDSLDLSVAQTSSFAVQACNSAMKIAAPWATLAAILLAL